MASGVDLWMKGGWAMIPLGLNALLLYGKAAEIRVELGRKNFTRKRWQLKSSRCPYRSPLELARAYLESRAVKLAEGDRVKAVRSAFEQVRAQELPVVDRNLKFMKVAMSAAPLWGLLGTVTGMLVTFDSLSRGGGSDDTMNNIAGGISEALITTQTGLMVALPGYFFHYYLLRRRAAYSDFLFRLESSCVQQFMNGEVSEETADDTKRDDDGLTEAMEESGVEIKDHELGGGAVPLPA